MGKKVQQGEMLETKQNHMFEASERNRAGQSFPTTDFKHCPTIVSIAKNLFWIGMIYPSYVITYPKYEIL